MDDIEKMDKRLQWLGQEASLQSIEKYSGWIEKVSDDLMQLFHKTLDDMGDKYCYIIRKTYLQGAIDRERMLR